jgi:hypothetical protein
MWLKKMNQPNFSTIPSMSEPNFSSARYSSPPLKA